MIRRTTIELDVDLVARAKKVLGTKTTRAAVEEALQRAVAGAEKERSARLTAQRAYLDGLHDQADLEVLNSEEMWR